MSYNRGDVVLVLYPDSNLHTAKRRPAIVVQRDGLGTGLSQSVLAMISSNPARAGHPCRVSIAKSSHEGVAMGLRTDSIIMTDNLATILDKEIDRGIGHLDGMADIDVALRHTLAL
jgi:mRNA interferase MazF